MTAEELIRKVPKFLRLGPFRTLLEEAYAKGYAEGYAEGIRRTILVQGRKKFGEPTAEQTSVLSATADLDWLKSLSLDLLDVTTWEELLRSG